MIRALAIRVTYFSVLAAGLGGCASTLQSLKAAITGEPADDKTAVAEAPAPDSRLPSSNGKAITLDSGGTGAFARARPVDEPSGPDLTRNEFNPLKRQSDDRAAHGYRRNADPWEGTGGGNEGSLWNPDSQDDFYFSKNLLHKMGDIIIVKVEPDVNDALNAKINALLPRDTVAQVVADETGKAVGDKVGTKVSAATGNDKVGAAVGNLAKTQTVAAIEPKVKHLDVEDIPVRIVETLPKNSFRVEGARRVFIRNAPYQLKISGIIRDEDIGPQTLIASSKVIDSKLELTR